VLSEAPILCGGQRLDGFLILHFADVISRWIVRGGGALAEDGVSLLPDTAPMGANSYRPGFFFVWTPGDQGSWRDTRSRKEEIDWKDMGSPGDGFGNGGSFNQEVMPPGEKPPIEVYGGA